MNAALNKRAKQARRFLLAMIYYAESGHPGGSLSCVELIVALAEYELAWRESWNEDSKRNRLVLSKGHACPALYAVAAEYGLITKSELLNFRQINSMLQGHPHVKTTPWAETSTGSLGQGFSVAIGMAMGLRFQGNITSRVYAILGDGELQEGQVWEGVMLASHYQLDNFCAIIDYNKMQSDDLNVNIVGVEPLAEKWKAFGWHILEIDGHNFSEINTALAVTKEIKNKPSLIIAHTIKGKGISFMESSPLWHGSVKLRKDEFIQALSDLSTSAEGVDFFLQKKLDDIYATG